jgi:hypothetical protein
MPANFPLLRRKTGERLLQRLARAVRPLFGRRAREPPPLLLKKLGKLVTKSSAEGFGKELGRECGLRLGEDLGTEPSSQLGKEPDKEL